MKYDIFISYSRKDNEQGRVSELIDHIKEDFENLSGRRLRPFFDINEIRGGEDWEGRILSGLKESRLLLAFLSPNFFESEYCQKEFEEYLKYELSRTSFREGIAPIYFIELPDDTIEILNNKGKGWVSELKKRQHYDLRSWFNNGKDALQKSEVVEKLKELREHIWEQVREGEIEDARKGNLERKNSRFFGRESEIQRLHDDISHSSNKSPILIVNGIGGMGKTTLVTQYAHAFNEYFAGGCWIIPCEGKSNIKQVFSSLRGKRDLDFELTDEEIISEDLQFERVLKELKMHATQVSIQDNNIASRYSSNKRRQKVLIILDYVDNSTLLSDDQLRYIPQAEWIIIIATTRLSSEELQISKETLLHILDELKIEDGVKLIESYRPDSTFSSPKEIESAKLIVEKMGQLPLAIEVAAVYMGENYVSCESFLSRYQRESLEYFSQVENSETSKIRHGEKCLSITLQSTFEKLSEQELLLLKYASLFPSDQIPSPWLRRLISIRYPDYGAKAACGEADQWIILIRKIVGFRLLQIADRTTYNSIPRTFKMNRLIGGLVLRKLTNDELIYCHQNIEKLVKERCDFLYKASPIKDYIWEIEALSALTLYWIVYGYKPGILSAAEITNLLHKVGLFQELRHLLVLSIETFKECLDEYPRFISSCFRKLGRVELELGNLINAHEFIEQAINIAESYCKKHGSLLSDIYADASVIERKCGDMLTAKQYINTALNIDKEICDKNHPKLARDYHCLANIERSIGDLESARFSLKHAIEIDEMNSESYPLDLSCSYSDMALIEADLGNLSSAQKLLNKALEIQGQELGDHSCGFAILSSHLGLIESRLGNFETAKKLFLRSITIGEQDYENMQSHLAMFYYNLGSMESNLSLIEDNYEKMVEAKNSLMNAKGLVDNPGWSDLELYAKVYHNLSFVEACLDNLETAMQILLEAKSMLMGNNHDMNLQYIKIINSAIKEVEKKLTMRKKKKKWFSWLG